MKKRETTSFWAGLVSCLLPIGAGMILYSQMPIQVPVQWDLFTGQVTNTLARWQVVLGGPLVLAVLYWILHTSLHKTVWGSCMLGFLREGLSWFIPVVSMLMYSSIYSYQVLGNLQPVTVVYGLVGLLLIAMGSYLPALEPGSKLGIRDEYTQMGERHWYQVHRFAAGCVMLAGGTILLAGWLHPTLSWWMLIWPVLPAAPHIYSLAQERQSFSE